MTAPHKPVPKPTPDTQPFWDGTAAGELRVQRCRDCSRHCFYPRPCCPSCGSGELEWVVTSGRATLYSYVINHRPAPGFEEEGPYAIAVVELELTRRNVELFAARVGRRFLLDDYGGWWDAVDAIIDEYVVMHRTVPGFRSLHFGDVVDLNLDSVADNNTVIAGRLRGLLLAEYGLADSEELDLAIMVAVEAGDAVLKLAFRHDPGGAPAIVSEAKKLVRGYLSCQLTPHTG